MSCLCPSPLVTSASAIKDRPSALLRAPLVCRFRHSSSTSFWAGTQLQQSHRRRRGFQSAARFSTRTSAVLEVSQDTWEAEVLQASKPVLVDFWATWCGPCKLVLPSVQWIEQEYGDHLKVVKVEADPNPKLMEKYKVYGLPTLLLFRDGEEVPNSHWEGAVNKAKLIAWLEKHEAVPVREQSTA